MDTKANKGGTKLDSEKADLSLLSSSAVFAIGRVMTFGKKKYSSHNWRKGIALSRLLAASLRHIFQFLAGEDKDPESGESHLAHAGCCIMMALELHETRPDLDDRYKGEPVAEVSDNTRPLSGNGTDSGASRHPKFGDPIVCPTPADVDAFFADNPISQLRTRSSI